MRKFTKFPLYLGLFVLVVSVLISATKLGEERALTYQRTRAASSGATLTMRYLAPHLVSVLLKSEKKVAGVDVVIRYPQEKIAILPSSLTSGPSFITTGGAIDEKASTFSFSALVKDTPVRSAIVATFSVQSKNIGGGEWVNLEFDTANGNTAVIEEEGSTNILTRADGVRFSPSSQ